MQSVVTIAIVVVTMLTMCKAFRLQKVNYLTNQINRYSATVYKSGYSFLSMQASDSSPVRVRFAPSPTGSLHVGGARTALFNWLLAKKTGGKFLVRVEDTDEARSTRESEASILEDLRWLGLAWDEGPEIGGPYGPYRQSERKEIYKEAAERLIKEGKAYRCFCTEEELEQKRIAAEEAGVDPKYDGTWRDADPAEVEKRLANGDPYTVRFRVPPGKVVFIDDKVRGRVTWDADASLGDFIILRSNGMPVYNFCVSVDDATMKITHVVRAEEHLTNTLRQMLVLEALECQPPTYAHCSLILGSDRSKLSKRHGATSLKQFSEQGFIPVAMMNYLANLGWNDGTDKEIYSPQELWEAFSLDRIIKSAAVFDLEKLTWINAQHLRAMDATEVQKLVFDALFKTDNPILTDKAAESNPSFEKFLGIASKIAQRDMELLTDAPKLVGNCLKYSIDQTLANDEHVEEVLGADSFSTLVKTIITDYETGALPTGKEDNFDDLWKTYMKALGKNLGLKGKNLFHPVRLALTGNMSGPDIGDQLKLVSLSDGIVSANFPVAPLSSRIDYLRKISSLDKSSIIASAKVVAV